jgi:hypothetical protein
MSEPLRRIVHCPECQAFRLLTQTRMCVCCRTTRKDGSQNVVAAKAKRPTRGKGQRK